MYDERRQRFKSIVKPIENKYNIPKDATRLPRSATDILLIIKLLSLINSLLLTIDLKIADPENFRHKIDCFLAFFGFLSKGFK